MIISSVATKNFHGIAHDSVYGTLDQTGYMKGAARPSMSLKGKVHLPARQKHNRKRAYRVAHLFGQYQRFLFALKEREQGVLFFDSNVKKLQGCYPGGVLFKEPPKGTGYNCKRYSVCPWCRYRMVHSLAQTLIPLLPKAKKLAYITLCVPCQRRREMYRFAAV